MAGRIAAKLHRRIVGRNCVRNGLAGTANLGFFSTGKKNKSGSLKMLYTLKGESSQKQIDLKCIKKKKLGKLSNLETSSLSSSYSGNLTFTHLIHQNFMFDLLTDVAPQPFLSNRPQFLWVYRRNKPTRNVGRTREKLVNHEPGVLLTSKVRLLRQ